MPASVEEYMPPGIFKEEAIQIATENFELVELSQWEVLGLQLHASAHSDAAAPPPPAPAPPLLAPNAPEMVRWLFP
jgi:hypothetical protein